MEPPTYHTVKEVAQRFRKHPRTIRDWITTGCPTPHGLIKLEAAKLGKTWEIKDEWLAVFELRVRPTTPRPDLDLD